MIKPSAVVFDLGKVLVDFDYRIAAERLIKRSTITAEQLQQLIDQSSLLLQYEAGALTTPEFFSAVKAAAGFRGELEEFAEIFGNIFLPIESMVSLHGQLCGQGMPTYLLSNTNELAVQYISQHFPFYNAFTGHVISYQLRLMKPDRRIYEAVEKLAGRQGPALVYIDDRPENVAGSVVLGWQGIVHESPEKTREALQQLGVV